MIRRLASALCLAVVGMAAAPGMEQTVVPMEVQAPLLVKILAYDRALPERVGEELVVGILYQERVRESLTVKDAALAHFGHGGATHLQKTPVRAVVLPLGDMEELTELIRLHGVDVVYVAPLRAVSISELVLHTRAAGVSTITGVPAYVEGGVAVGVAERGGRPRIVVNLGASRAEGSEYRAELLRLATVVEGGPPRD